ncbi:low temperature requirement A, partial [Kipferlia bialata]|eukprot:g11527.t1
MPGPVKLDDNTLHALHHFIDASKVHHFQYMKPHRSVSWLELFYDLVFVVFIARMVHSLTHLDDEGHFHFDTLVDFFLTFLPLWWTWMCSTFYLN